MSVHKYKRPALLSYIHVPPNLSATTDSYFVSLPQREPDNWLTDLFNTVAFELHDGTLPIRARVKITSEQAHAVRAKYSCADTGCDAMVTPWVSGFECLQRRGCGRIPRRICIGGRADADGNRGFGRRF